MKDDVLLSDDQGVQTNKHRHKHNEADELVSIFAVCFINAASMTTYEFAIYLVVNQKYVTH